MEDVSQMISQVLGDPEKMRQIQEMAASLGLGGGSSEPVPSPPAPAPSSNGGAGGLDLSGLSAVLAGLGGGQNSGPSNQNNNQSSGQAPDLSALSGLLSGLTGGGQSSPASPPAQKSGGFDVSSLAAMLNSGNPQTEQQAGSAGGFDLGALMKVQSAMANLQANKANVDLLLSLKPRLRPERSKKIDDAVRIMQIIQFLPLLKESGLFGEMDNILGSLGSLGSSLGGGRLGNLIGGIGGNLLPGIGGRR